MKTRINENEIDIYKVEEPIYQSDITPIILYALSKNIHFMFDSTGNEKKIHLF